MKGWVYVTSNAELPGLVKIGFSTKEPRLRARELNLTGVPEPHVVEYEVLVENPYEIERQTHASLRDVHYKKEFFRCTVRDAVSAIREIIGDRALYENPPYEALIQNGLITPGPRLERAISVTCGGCFKPYVMIWEKEPCPSCGHQPGQGRP